MAEASAPPPPAYSANGEPASAPDGLASEHEKSLASAQQDVSEAELQLRTLLAQLGQDATPVIVEIKANPSQFVKDPSPVKKDLADRLVKLEAVSKRVTAELNAKKEHDARMARAEARRTDEEELFAEMKKDANEMVQLNVGGQVFTTAKSTLLVADEGSRLDVLFSDRHGELASPVFIDRNPKMFEYVLEFLRSVKVGAPVEQITDLGVDSSDYPALLREARFFGLVGLAKLVGEMGVGRGTGKVPYDDIVQCYSHNRLKLFVGLDLSGYSFRGWVLSGAELRNCNLRRCDFTNVLLKYATLEGADCTGATFRFAVVTTCTFKNATGLDLTGCAGFKEGKSAVSADGVFLANGIDYREGEQKTFDIQDLAYCDFRAAKLSQANLEGARLHGAVFRDATLNGANFKGADLTNVDLHSANLHSACFEGANLTSADLKSAKLDYAKFEGADLTNADFRGAIIDYYTTFKGATIAGADFTGCTPSDPKSGLICVGTNGGNNTLAPKKY